ARPGETHPRLLARREARRGPGGRLQDAQREGRGPSLRAQAGPHGDGVLASYAGSQVKRTLWPPCVQVTKRASEWMSRLAVQLNPSTEQARCGPIGESG